MPATKNKPGKLKLRWPVFRDVPTPPQIYTEQLEIQPEEQAQVTCCHMHKVSSKYLALNSVPYSIGNRAGNLVQGQRYDFPDDIARMLVDAGYLRPLNPWEQLVEEVTDAS